MSNPQLLTRAQVQDILTSSYKQAASEQPLSVQMRLTYAALAVGGAGGALVIGYRVLQ